MSVKGWIYDFAGNFFGTLGVIYYSGLALNLFEPVLLPGTRKMGQQREKSILGILGDLFSENARLPYREGFKMTFRYANRSNGRCVFPYNMTP